MSVIFFSSKIAARPDLAAHLLQILIPTIFNCLFYVKKENSHFGPVLEDGLLGEYLVIVSK